VREIAQALLSVLASGQPGALATVVRVRGSTPQQPGARLLLRADGSTLGTVGGGAIERVVLEALAKTLQTGRGEFISKDLGYDLGMCCGGRMEVLIEPVLAAPRLWLLGAGHVAHALAPIAQSIGFDVGVIDEREELNTEQRFAGCQRFVRDAVEFLKQQPMGPQDWLLIVTHDHPLDEQLLELATRQNPRYIGLVGSRRKLYRFVERYAARGRALQNLERVYAPVGLDLGAVSPAEIAVSIAAELVALRHGKPVPHLRERSEIVARRFAADAAEPALAPEYES
jgi:xanthine dehydrogenase accessory factor